MRFNDPLCIIAHEIEQAKEEEKKNEESRETNFYFNFNGNVTKFEFQISSSTAHHHHTHTHTLDMRNNKVSPHISFEHTFWIWMQKIQMRDSFFRLRLSRFKMPR